MHDLVAHNVQHYFLLFFSECLVDTIKSCEIGSHHDALVYTAGAMKHLSSNNPTAQKELVSLEAIEGLALILDAISKDVSTLIYYNATTRTQPLGTKSSNQESFL